MATLRYINHPQVLVDPAVPVPEWSISDVGRQRVIAMLHQPWVGSITRIVSSAETKAVETAGLLAAHLDLHVEIRPETGEIDRSATGFVPHDQHDELSEAFFAAPDRSAEGWEVARDAQRRIFDGLADLLAEGDSDWAVVGHGAVGTLLYCALGDYDIDRRRDQPGQGHYFNIDLSGDLSGPTVEHWWKAIDG